jgi:hypothetical protein
MSASTPTPETTLLILLGASRFPELGLDTKDPLDAANAEASFLATAQEVENYFTSPTGFNISKLNVCRLFNSEDGPDRQDSAISKFLTDRIGAGGNGEAVPTDLVIYYIGHGTPDDSRMYCLALHNTRSSNVGVSSLRVVDMARTLAIKAAQLRVYLILDACYAANATSAFTQNRSPLESLRLQIDQSENLPPCGVSLLCSSSSISPSLLLASRKRTMFSESLLEVLWSGNGDETLDYLSLADLHAATAATIRHKNPGIAIRPEIHSPQQPVGDISHIPLFPNNVGVVREARIREREARTRAQQEEAHRKEQAEQELLRAQAEKLQLEDLEAEGVHDRSLDTELLIRWLKRTMPVRPSGPCGFVLEPKTLKQVLERIDEARGAGLPVSFASAADAHCRECRLRSQNKARKALIAKRRKAVLFAVVGCILLAVADVYFVSHLRFALALANKDFDSAGPPIASLWLLRAHISYITVIGAVFGTAFCGIGAHMFLEEVMKKNENEGIAFFFALIIFLFGGVMLWGTAYFLWDWGWGAAVQGQIQAKPTEWEGWVFVFPEIGAVFFLFASLYWAYCLIREAYSAFTQKA